MTEQIAEILAEILSEVCADDLIDANIKECDVGIARPGVKGLTLNTDQGQFSVEIIVREIDCRPKIY